MNKVAKIAAALAFALASGTAAADKFDGLYIGGGVAFNKMTSTLTDSGSAYVYGDTFSYREEVISGDDDHDAGFNLNVGYGMSFGNFNVAIEATYASSYGEAEAYSYAESFPGYSYGESATTELTSGKSIAILPGYKLGADTLVYGRLGYVEAEGELSWSDTDGWSDSVSKDFNGTIWGIGMKHAVTPNLLAVLEYQVTEFDSESIYSDSFYDSPDVYGSSNANAEPASTGVTLGVQYTF